ncbi:MAG: alpha/beta hydrolase [Pseudomonadota bacterium]
MRATFQTPDGCRLAYEVAGQGPAVLWQHGLGATASQPAEVFPEGFTRITLLCRGHDGSDLGDPARLSIAQFATDALALMDHLGLQSLPIGGISLGAAIALRLAVLHPARVQALILARPAWVDQPAPATMQSYAEVARLLARHGEIGRALFQSGQTYRDLSLASPDNAASLVSFFTRPQPDTTVALLQSIPQDGPGVTLAQIGALTLPTLVLTTGQDYVHPAAYGAELAKLIPHAILTDLPAKGQDKPAHVSAFRAALAQFLGALA